MSRHADSLEFSPSLCSIEQNPELMIVPDSTQHFTPESFIPVEDIDLSQLRTHGNALDKEAPDGRKVVTFLARNGFSTHNQEIIEDCFSYAVGDLLGQTIDIMHQDEDDIPEMIDDFIDNLELIYDYLEIKEPRFIRLLDRVRDEQLFSDEHTASIVKLSLLFGLHYRINQLNKPD